MSSIMSNDSNDANDANDSPPASKSERFRTLHAVGRLLILPNAWDAASARVVAACGAEAVATTSAGVAWSHGYRDGGGLPPRLLEATVAAIVRAVDLPLTVDMEDAYTDDARTAGERVAAAARAGAVGINIEDGTRDPALLCAKVEAARRALASAGLDLFINVRTDVYLRGLAPPERAAGEALERARRYRDAGADGIFVPGASTPADLRALVEGTHPLPLNVMARPGLPDAAALRALGVRRLSAGSGIASAAYGFTRRAAAAFLRDGQLDAAGGDAISFAEMNALFPAD
jgi:2-methylisocitrate lyase-like PEP mutase family enzyme